MKIKATSPKLKQFLRSCNNAYIPVNLGHGMMDIKIIKKALSEQISLPEYRNCFWEYEILTTDTGPDIRITAFPKEYAGAFRPSSSSDEEE